MPDIYKIILDDCLFNEVDQLTCLLPDNLLERFYRYKVKMDAYRYLCGRSLLCQAMLDYGLPGLNLNEIEYDTYNKPYIPNSIQFNNTHTGNIVLCAVSKFSRVGIDIELIDRNLHLNEFRDCFTYREWQVIMTSPAPLDRFFDFWTKKESVIKAEGKGLSLLLQSFEVLGNEVTIAEKHWYMRQVNIDADYKAHICCEERGDYIRIINVGSIANLLKLNKCLPSAPRNH